jgi:hypothetical protein
LFPKDSVLEKYRIAQIFGLRFPTLKSYIYFVQKLGLGYILGDFFTNSSGHPAAN